MQSMKLQPSQTVGSIPKPPFPFETNQPTWFGRSNPAFRPAYTVPTPAPAPPKPKKQRNVIVVNGIEIDLDGPDDAPAPAPKPQKKRNVMVINGIEMDLDGSDDEDDEEQEKRPRVDALVTTIDLYTSGP